MKKTGRNDPCVCGSGKKFKKCCESKMLGGRFMAARVETGSSEQIRKVAGLTSFFKGRVGGEGKISGEVSPEKEQNPDEKKEIC